MDFGFLQYQKKKIPATVTASVDMHNTLKHLNRIDSVLVVYKIALRNTESYGAETYSGNTGK